MEIKKFFGDFKDLAYSQAECIYFDRGTNRLEFVTGAKLWEIYFSPGNVSVAEIWIVTKD